ncbi:MAG: ThiF family adenylyltransferase [Betaproteobacteria bacterium]|nr:ThiF family adenylyltransferase [Betaproteobacteria bacterium]
MKTSLEAALDRTLLLMRDELDDRPRNDVLLAALTETEIALVADASDLKSHSAQSAYITAAMLMARSGHRVHLAAPDVPLVGPQPPLKEGGLISCLLEVGEDLLPGITFQVGQPKSEVDLGIRFRDTKSDVLAKRIRTVSFRSWSASLRSSNAPAKSTRTDWPFGGLASAGLISAEGFKIAMQKLSRFARNPSTFRERFANIVEVDFHLAPHWTPQATNLGQIDFISAGAIINCALFTLARIPRLIANGRIVDADISDISNLNRNALLLRSMLGLPKVTAIAGLDLGGLKLQPVETRYDLETQSLLRPLASNVLVGVDDIPTRWLVQRDSRGWLGVGATSHWSSMASFHTEGLACAGCLHPTDDPNDATIPTVAFVSFWAGLLLATYLVRAASGEMVPLRHQQIFMTPLRPEQPWRSSIVKRLDCPVEIHGDPTSQELIA